MERRDFLRGMAGILAAGTAPWIITTPGLLMPVKDVRRYYFLTGDTLIANGNIWFFNSRVWLKGQDCIEFEVPFNNCNYNVIAASYQGVL